MLSFSSFCCTQELGDFPRASTDGSDAEYPCVDSSSNPLEPYHCTLIVDGAEVRGTAVMHFTAAAMTRPIEISEPEATYNSAQELPRGSRSRRTILAPL